MPLTTTILVFLLYITTIKSSLITLYKNETNKFSGLQGYVQYSTGEDVGFISGSSWNYYDAHAVCSELGFYGVASFMTDSVMIDIPVEIPVVISSLQCVKSQGVSGCLDENGTTVIFDESEIQLVNIAGVSCAGIQPIRLSGGFGPHEGKIEVLYNNTWGSVCDDFWGKKDADVACKQLGYAHSLSSTGDNYNQVMTSKIWLDNTNCTGNETSLLLCNQSAFGSHDCMHSEDASVVCQMPTNCAALPRIANCNISSSDTTVDSEIFFQCHEKYSMIGSNHLSCDSYGEWSGEVPLCVDTSMLSSVTEEVFIQALVKPGDAQMSNANACAKLLVPQRGSMNTTTHVTGVSVKFSCNDGYDLIGNLEITCSKHGQRSRWNGFPPICYNQGDLIDNISPSGTSASKSYHHSSLVNRNMILVIILASAVGFLSLVATVIAIIAYVIVRKRKKPKKCSSDLTIPLVDTDGGTDGEVKC